MSPAGPEPGDGILAIGVVVPARDEEELLPGCLRALRAAVAHPGRGTAAVRVLVVADGCVDRTAERAGEGGAEVLRIGAPGAPGNVGAARDAGARWLLGAAAADGVPPGRVWLASTDADSAVPEDWLAVHGAAAGAGADAVVGLVAVADWRGLPAGVPASFERAYGAWRAAGPAAVHPHVHGTNLGVRGSAYLACGGFPPLRVGEDVALVRALEEAGAAVLRTPVSPVRTSARRVPRARGGFGDDIAVLSSGLPAC